MLSMSGKDKISVKLKAAQVKKLFYTQSKRWKKL